MIGVEIDVGIDSDDFGLGETLVTLEAVFVVRLDATLLLGGEEFVEDVRIPIEPCTAADGDEGEQDECRCEARQPRTCL